MNLAQGSARVVGCFLCAFFHLRFKECLVCGKLFEFCLNGSKRVCADLADGKLEFAVSLTLELSFDLVGFLSRKARVYGDEIIYSVLAVCKSNAGIGVGYRALEFSYYSILARPYITI